jgi:hypothetical protein
VLYPPPLLPSGVPNRQEAFSICKGDVHIDLHLALFCLMLCRRLNEGRLFCNVEARRAQQPFDLGLG